MSTRFIVIILQYMQMPNHEVVHLKLIVLYVSLTSIQQIGLTLPHSPVDTPGALEASSLAPGLFCLWSWDTTSSLMLKPLFRHIKIGNMASTDFSTTSRRVHEWKYLHVKFFLLPSSLRPMAYGVPKGSDPSCSCDLHHSCSSARSLTLCARPGIELASQSSRDATDLRAPQWELYTCIF